MTESQPNKAELDRITSALAAPFDPSEIKFKPAVVSGNRALALAYTDARVIQDRLDDVLGVTGWQDDYTPLPDGSVMCKLSLCIAGQWLTKMDVGSQSEQSDAGDRMKAAFSDSLKRTAVKFGIGRYLYRLPSQWVDFDPNKKQFVRPPQLPPWAIPQKKPADLTDGQKEIQRSGMAQLRDAAKDGIAGLARVWKSMSAEAKELCQEFKDELKEKISLAAKEQSNATA